MINPCPHCGAADDVYVKTRAFGWAEQYFSARDGMPADLIVDRVGYKDTKTIRCAACGEVRNDLSVDDTIGAVVQRAA